jgi:P4 family phage/plasmid primase-like protien
MTEELPRDDVIAAVRKLYGPENRILSTQAEMIWGASRGHGRRLDLKTLMFTDYENQQAYSGAELLLQAGMLRREPNGHSEMPVLVPYSDDALAYAFSERHAEELRYLAAKASWLEWDGARWTSERTLRIYDLARVLCREQADTVKSKNLKRAVAGAGKVAAVERLAKTDRRHATKLDDWDKHPGLVTPGGTVDLRSGLVRSNRREDFATKMVSVTPDRTATPTLWLKFLYRVTNQNPDLISYLQRVCGYCLTIETIEHALFFLYGTGQNGKGVFHHTFQAILNDYATTAPMDLFVQQRTQQTDYYALAHLWGARLASAEETESWHRWSESKIKSLTGGDTITSRFLFHDFFDFRPTFKIMITGNNKPAISNVDVAIKRRLQLIPFTVTIPPDERDPKLEDKLKAEYPAILQWMIAGAVEWYRTGLNPPAAVIDASEEYFKAEDRMGLWLEECCDIAKNVSAWTSSLYKSWSTWTKDRGEEPGSQKRFSQDLANRGFVGEHKRDGAWVLGVTIKTPDDLPPL